MDFLVKVKKRVYFPTKIMEGGFFVLTFPVFLLIFSHFLRQLPGIITIISVIIIKYLPFISTSSTLNVDV